MQKLTLYTNSGHEVATVTVPSWQTPVELYQWGARFFVRRADGRYTEVAGSFYVAVVDVTTGTST